MSWYKIRDTSVSQRGYITILLLVLSEEICCFWLFGNKQYNVFNFIEVEWRIYALVNKPLLIQIIWTSAGILLSVPLRTKLSEIFIENHAFSFKKMNWNKSSGKWRPFCLGLYVLISCRGMQVLSEELFVLSRYFITMTSQWMGWRLKSPASRLFTQSFIRTQIKENIKAPLHWPLRGEFTGDRWFPRTKG